MPRRIEVVRHVSEVGRWEMAVGVPAPALQPFVREYVGGFEDTPLPLVRRELPSDIAPLIINFGAPFRVFDHDDSRRFTELTSFVTGAFDSYVLVGTTGAYACVQVNFTILGARLFLGGPLNVLANQVVPVEDVFGAAAARLTAALHDAPDWASRFDLVEQEIRRRLDTSRPPPPAVRWMLGELVRHHGGVGIGALAREIGWSHKHVVSRFTEEIGLPPKTLARVLRFGRAAERLKVAARGQLADIACDCGYFDQAHFTRDFRAFAGVSPMELLASQLPDRGGFAVPSP